MTLPAAIVGAVEARVNARVIHGNAVSGGCISRTAHLQLDDGTDFFLKWSDAEQALPGLFREEARSLEVIAKSQTVRVPRVLDVQESVGRFSWLLLEWLESGERSANSWRQLGLDLARLHQQRAESYGWPSNNFIGSLPQSNVPCLDWEEFWRSERLLPQLTAAERHFTAHDCKRMQRLLSEGLAALHAAREDGVSLLHGDLWIGNVLMLADGSAAVVDPSSYYGHREVDLAMAKLFGGFPDEFFRVYEEVSPLLPEHERRRAIYQLYYLLVHVNVFGGAYRQQTLGVVAQLGF